MLFSTFSYSLRSGNLPFVIFELMFQRSVVFAVWLFGVRLFDVQLFVVCVPDGLSGKWIHRAVIHHSVTAIKIIHKMNCELL